LWYGMRLGRARVQTARTRWLAMAHDPNDRPRPREPAVAGAGCCHPLHTGRRRGSRRRRNAGRNLSRDHRRLANYAYHRESRCSTISATTICSVPDTLVTSPQEASFGNETTLGERALQGLAILSGLLITAHAWPTHPWKPEPWLEIRADYRTSADQPPTSVPKNPFL